MNTILDVTTTGDKPDEAAQRRAFYADVVGTDGQGYCLAELKPGGGMVHTWADTFEGFIQQAEKRVGRVARYYALAAYGNETNDKGKRARTQANAISLKVFPLDIDCGAEKHAKNPAGTYATLQEGIAALKAFIKATGLRPTYVVESGAGLHVYFVMDKPVPVAEWEPVARALGDLAKVHGLRVDTSVTTNAAGVLRLIGSEHQNGRRVKVGHVSGKVYGLAEFAAKVGAGSAQGTATTASRVKLKVNDALQLDGPPYSAARAAEKCAALQAVAGCGGNVSEPLWRGALGVLKFASDGADLLHPWSSGHPDYDPAETDKKLDGWRGTGPTKCDTFRKHFKGCAECPHKVSYPMQLGWTTAIISEPAKPTATADSTSDAPGVVDPVADALLAEFNACNFVAGDGAGRPAIWCEDYDHEMNLPRLTAMTRSDFELRHANRQVRVPDGQGGARKQPAATWWLQHPRRRQYAGMGLWPGRVAPAGYYNRWRGFAVEPAEGDVAPFVGHVNMLCAGDAGAAEYVLKWAAHCVQHPDRPAEVAIVLRGGQGSGKGMVGRLLVGLFGRHGLHLTHTSHLVGNFNGHMTDALYVFADEITWGGDKAAEGVLKALVTEDTVQIEAKGRDSYRARNRLKLMIASNSDWVIPAGTDERRYLVIDVSGARVGDFDYFNRLQAWADNGGRAALLHYLLYMDLSSFNVRKVPSTAALDKQKIRSLPTVDRWILEALDQGTALAGLGEWTENGLTVICANGVTSFEDYARRTGGRWARADAREIGARLNQVFDCGPARVVQRDVGRARGWVLPGLTPARALAAGAFGLRHMVWQG